MSELNKLPPEAKKVFQGTIFSVWQWEQELYDGSYKTFEGLKLPDSVNVIGAVEDGRILLVSDEQPYRPAVLTPVGGKVDEGEDLETAARRELKEETGYEAETFVPWFSYQPSGKAESQVHMFVAHGLKKTGEPNLEPGERIKPLYFTFEEFLAVGKNPEMRDLRLRIELLEALLSPEKQAQLKQLFYGRN